MGRLVFNADFFVENFKVNTTKIVTGGLQNVYILDKIFVRSVDIGQRWQ